MSLPSVGLRVWCLWFSFIDLCSFSQSLQGQWWPDEDGVKWSEWDKMKETISLPFTTCDHPSGIRLLLVEATCAWFLVWTSGNHQFVTELAVGFMSIVLCAYIFLSPKRTLLTTGAWGKTDTQCVCFTVMFTASENHTSLLFQSLT